MGNNKYMENYTIDNKIRTNLLPVIPLRGKVAFPNTNVLFEVGREMTLKAVNRANATADKLVFICTQKVTEKDEITAEDIYTVGCVARIRQVSQINGGAMRVLCEGLYRARAREITVADGHFSAVCDELKMKRGDEVLEEAYFRTAKALVKDVLGVDGKIGKDIALKLDACADAEEYMNIALSAMRVKLEIKQQSLEKTDVVERLKLFEKCLNDELEISKIEKKIRDEFDKQYREKDAKDTATPAVIEPTIAPTKKKHKSSGGVIVDGEDGCVVKFAKCCNPLPGEDIVGFITKGYGISIHRIDCPNVQSAFANDEYATRFVKAEWDTPSSSSYRASYETSLQILVTNRMSMLAEISVALAEMRIDIVSISTKNVEDTTIINMTIACRDVSHFNSIISRLKSIKDVIRVTRSMGTR